MPYLSNIVEKIDSVLAAGSLSDARFQNRFFGGLCQLIPTRSQDGTQVFFVPAKVNNHGDAVQVVPDDQLNLTTYHRIISNTYSAGAQRSQFGDDIEVIASVSDLLLTVIAFTNKILLSADQLEALFITGFPGAFEKSFADSLQMNRIAIQPVSTNFDSVAIFGTEYRGEKYFLKPESVMFQIRYRVEQSFKKGCFNICDC